MRVRADGAAWTDPPAHGQVRLPKHYKVRGTETLDIAFRRTNSTGVKVGINAAVWRAQTLAERANQPPPRADEPASESESALRAFLDARGDGPRL